MARAPAAPENAQALQAALTKALKDPAALAALAKLLGEQGVAASTQTANVIGRQQQDRAGQPREHGSISANGPCAVCVIAIGGSEPRSACQRSIEPTVGRRNVVLP